MRKLLIALLSLGMLSAACKKEGMNGVDPTPNPPVDTSTPTPKIPAELVGKWSYGTFSPTNFWDYNGTYAGNACS